MSKFIALGLRASQILSAAVVLGLSANLYNAVDRLHDACDYWDVDCDLGGFGPSIGYCAFVGAWGLLAASIGIAAVFADAVKFVIVAGVDGFGAMAFLAGGIRLAVLLGQGQCPAGNTACDQLKADAAFLFLGFLVTIALLVFGFVRQRSGRGHSAV